jgi:hypothetical protein
MLWAVGAALGRAREASVSALSAGKSRARGCVVVRTMMPWAVGAALCRARSPALTGSAGKSRAYGGCWRGGAGESRAFGVALAGLEK